MDLINVISAPVIFGVHQIISWLVICQCGGIALLFLFLRTSHVKTRFFLFIALVFLFVVGLFYANLDGIGLLILSAELVLGFVFIFLYFQHNSSIVQSDGTKTLYYYKLGLVFTIVCLIFTNLVFGGNWVVEHLESWDYYSFSTNIVSEEFIMIFFFFVFFYTLILVSITVVLGYFSIVFILIFILQKQTTHQTKASRRDISFLRKQNLSYQARYTANLRTFQRDGV